MNTKAAIFFLFQLIAVALVLAVLSLTGCAHDVTIWKQPDGSTAINIGGGLWFLLFLWVLLFAAARGGRS